jgi:hypothetical protein
MYGHREEGQCAMARTAAFWEQCRSVFDPAEVLVGQRSKDFYHEREHSPFHHILVEFSPTGRPTRPSLAFFTGHRGSGKSSMLLRLLEEFARHYFVVYFDIEHNLDSRTANQIDLLYLLGATLFKVASDEGVNPDAQHLAELARSIYTVTYQTRDQGQEALNVGELAKGLICFGASMLGNKLVEKLAEAALKPFTFTSGVSEEVARKREIEPKVQDIINNVNLIIADVETRCNKPILVVVDGLDKLQRREQAELVFLHSRALLGPVCRVIYTVPMLIYTSPLFRQVEEECPSYLLPNIKLYARTADTQRYESGYTVLREVATKRLHALGLYSDDVFEPDVLDQLIFKSGGVMRQFIWLVRDAFSAAQIEQLDKVTGDAAQQAIDDHAAQLAFRLTTTRLEELRTVRQEKLPSGSPESSELLHGLFIVAYRNQRSWFDVHPLLWDEL